MKRAIKCIAFLAVLVNFALAQTPGQTKDNFGMKVVNIVVTQAWTPTGINCSIGDTLYIRVNGTFTATTDDPGAWCSPDGNGYSSDNTFPLPSASEFSVIGKIGSSGTGFNIGSYRIYAVTVAGELNLGVNDIVNFADNGGTLVAQVLQQQNHILK